MGALVGGDKNYLKVTFYLFKSKAIVMFKILQFRFLCTKFNDKSAPIVTTIKNILKELLQENNT